MFIITKDVICNGEFNGFTFLRTSKTGTELKELTAKMRKQCIYRFRLLDDDGHVYLYGLCSHYNNERAFQPLNFYMYDLGVTSIQYFNAGAWEVL